MEAEIVLGPRSMKQASLTSSDIVADVLVFGAVSAMIEIVWLQTVPLNLCPLIKIKHQNYLREVLQYLKYILEIIICDEKYFHTRWK